MTKQAPRKPTTPKAGVQPAIPTFGPEGREIFVRPESEAHPALVAGTVVHPDPDIIALTLPRATVEKILGGMMSRASVRCYNAQWITGTETALPLVVAKTLDTHPRDGGAYTWGQSGVSYEEAQTLDTLARALGYWVKPDEKGVYRPVKDKE